MARTPSILNLSLGWRALHGQIQRDATPLTLAAAVWLGMLAYFLWPTEPARALSLFPIGVGLIAWAMMKQHLTTTFLITCGLCFGWANLYTHVHPTPAWAAYANQSVWVAGSVASMQTQPQNPNRVTLTLTPLYIYKASARINVPDSLRLGVWQSQTKALVVGQNIAVPIQLLPPSGPQLPMQRDGRLWAWFNPTNTPAYATGGIEVTASAAHHLHASKPWGQGVAQRLATLRESIAQATKNLAGGIPTALLVGDQRGIAPELRTAYQQAGVSHLIAISGMQLTLVGVGVFALLRWLLAAVPILALRYPIKAYAALGALAVVIGYTLLVGAAPNILRAALMVGLVLIAYVLGRVRGLLRGLAWANILILLVQPHVVMSAGLQLSAAATLGLAIWIGQTGEPRGLWQWLKSSLWATIVAGAFTAPIALLHFGALAPLGLLGNLIAVPLMTVATYFAFASLVLWPFGLANLALAPLGWLSNITSAWAAWLAAFTPDGLVLYPWWVPLALAVFAALTLLALLGRKHLLLFAITLVVAVGLGMAQKAVSSPEIIVAENGIAAWRVHNAPNSTPTYQLLWAEDVSQATRLQSRLGPSTSTAQSAACCAEPMLLPPVYPFASAVLLKNNTWHIRPMHCARRWQKASASCTE